MDTSTMVSTPDLDLFVDNQPMNDEELSRLHESTLQMFRSNKIGPKNAFDIVLIDYLPAIFETTTFEDDHMNNFQSVGTTLETSAKIYAARIDSLYSETRKTQSILRSNNDNLQRILDDDDEEEAEANDEIGAERRISNNKKIRLMIKRKKSVVTDRQKLLRKNRTDEIRPIMINQYFLSAMNNDTMMLSELYEKINLCSESTKKKVKTEHHDPLSSSLQSNEFMCESLYIDTTQASTPLTDLDTSPSSDLTSTNKSTQLLLTPNSLVSSSTLNLSGTPIRSRTDSITSNSSILTNAAHLLIDTTDEYSYLDSSKVNAFMNGIHQSSPLDDVVQSPPPKPIRKRRISIEYPFPFLVEQAKKQRLTPKKLREQLLLNGHNQSLALFLRPPSPEYFFSSIDPPEESIHPLSEPVLPNLTDSVISNTSSVSKRQRAIDFRHLQSNMQKIIVKKFELNDQQLCFSELFSSMQLDHHRQSPSAAAPSSDIGICFAALLNNAVRYQLVLETNDLRDDLCIFSLQKNQEE